MSDFSAPETVALQFPSRLELLGMLDGIVVALCDRMHFDSIASTQVAMSVIEAGTNAIQHGHGRDPSKLVEVQFTMHDDRLEVVVRDVGTGFDLESLNGDVTEAERLLDPRGRGIFIMRSCMDSVDFEFTDAGTTCRLVKRRSESPPSGEEG